MKSTLKNEEPKNECLNFFILGEDTSDIKQSQQEACFCINADKESIKVSDTLSENYKISGFYNKKNKSLTFKCTKPAHVDTPCDISLKVKSRCFDRLNYRDIQKVVWTESDEMKIEENDIDIKERKDDILHALVCFNHIILTKKKHNENYSLNVIIPKKKNGKSYYQRNNTPTLNLVFEKIMLGIRLTIKHPLLAYTGLSQVMASSVSALPITNAPPPISGNNTDSFEKGVRVAIKSPSLPYTGLNEVMVSPSDSENDPPTYLTHYPHLEISGNTIDSDGYQRTTFNPKFPYHRECGLIQAACCQAFDMQRWIAAPPTPPYIQCPFGRQQSHASSKCNNDTKVTFIEHKEQSVNLKYYEDLDEMCKKHEDEVFDQEMNKHRLHETPKSGKMSQHEFFTRRPSLESYLSDMLKPRFERKHFIVDGRMNYVRYVAELPKIRFSKLAPVQPRGLSINPTRKNTLSFRIVELTGHRFATPIQIEVMVNNIVVWIGPVDDNDKDETCGPRGIYQPKKINLPPESFSPPLGDIESITIRQIGSESRNRFLVLDNVILNDKVFTIQDSTTAHDSPYPAMYDVKNRIYLSWFGGVQFKVPARIWPRINTTPTITLWPGRMTLNDSAQAHSSMSVTTICKDVQYKVIDGEENDLDGSVNNEITFPLMQCEEEKEIKIHIAQHISIPSLDGIITLDNNLCPTNADLWYRDAPFSSGVSVTLALSPNKNYLSYRNKFSTFKPVELYPDLSTQTAELPVAIVKEDIWTRDSRVEFETQTWFIRSYLKDLLMSPYQSLPSNVQDLILQYIQLDGGILFGSIYYDSDDRATANKGAVDQINPTKDVDSLYDYFSKCVNEYFNSLSSRFLKKNRKIVWAKQVNIKLTSAFHIVTPNILKAIGATNDFDDAVNPATIDGRNIMENAFLKITDELQYLVINSKDIYGSPVLIDMSRKLYDLENGEGAFDKLDSTGKFNWNTTTRYLKGQLAFGVNGALYISRLNNNANHEPSISPIWWEGASFAQNELEEVVNTRKYQSAVENGISEILKAYYANGAQKLKAGQSLLLRSRPHPVNFAITRLIKWLDIPEKAKYRPGWSRAINKLYRLVVDIKYRKKNAEDKDLKRKLIKLLRDALGYNSCFSSGQRITFRRNINLLLSGYEGSAGYILNTKKIPNDIINIAMDFKREYQEYISTAYNNYVSLEARYRVLVSGDLDRISKLPPMFNESSKALTDPDYYLNDIHTRNDLGSIRQSADHFKYLLLMYMERDELVNTPSELKQYYDNLRNIFSFIPLIGPIGQLFVNIAEANAGLNDINIKTQSSGAAAGMQMLAMILLCVPGGQGFAAILTAGAATLEISTEGVPHIQDYIKTKNTKSLVFGIASIFSSVLSFAGPGMMSLKGIGVGFTQSMKIPKGFAYKLMTGIERFEIALDLGVVSSMSIDALVRNDMKSFAQGMSQFFGSRVITAGAVPAIVRNVKKIKIKLDIRDGNYKDAQGYIYTRVRDGSDDSPALWKVSHVDGDSYVSNKFYINDPDSSKFSPVSNELRLLDASAAFEACKFITKNAELDDQHRISSIYNPSDNTLYGVARKQSPEILTPLILYKMDISGRRLDNDIYSFNPLTSSITLLHHQQSGKMDLLFGQYITLDSTGMPVQVQVGDQFISIHPSSVDMSLPNYKTANGKDIHLINMSDESGSQWYTVVRNEDGLYKVANAETGEMIYTPAALRINNEIKTKDIAVLTDYVHNMMRFKRIIADMGDDVRKESIFLDNYSRTSAEITLSSMGIKIKKATIPRLLVLLKKYASNTPDLAKVGAITWAIEHRAFKRALKSESIKFTDLYNKVNTGSSDYRDKITAPQGFLLNLLNDGFGGRCQPLAQLVLAAKQLEHNGESWKASELIGTMFKAAAVSEDPSRYASIEISNKDRFIGMLKKMHRGSNPDGIPAIIVERFREIMNDAISSDKVIDMITNRLDTDPALLLEVNTKTHAMCAWSINGNGNGNGRYGFYDPNLGIVEFSTPKEFLDFFNTFFNDETIGFKGTYQYRVDNDGNAIHEEVAIVDGTELLKHTFHLPRVGTSSVKDVVNFRISSESETA
ncbi:hypothetical protein [Endozoicomonas ascidiicola]|uniref:hypothetical protein n=1 Tax=Endozoicomonas ascidiicola TaxID=1698521 RepID=UPI000833D5F1|nr:hypothetical protein [Endozoicomonas ascidiicola]